MKYRINLLLPKEKTPIDKIIYFTLNYLRYILVITQIIVIGVFFYRFKIDQEIIDLKEELQQKQEIVLVSDPLIKEAKAIDAKVKIVKEILTNQEILKESLDYLLSRFPAKLHLSNFKINVNGEMNLNGLSEDAITIKLFYFTLIKEKKFSVVELTKIDRNRNGFSFNLRLKDFSAAKK